MKNIVLSMLLMTAAQLTAAQEWMNMHRTDENGLGCKIPIKIQQGTTAEMYSDDELITTSIPKEDGTTFSFPFYLDELDSISIVPSLLDTEKGHNKYRPFVMNIFTEDLRDIEEREE